MSKYLEQLVQCILLEGQSLVGTNVSLQERSKYVLVAVYTYSHNKILDEKKGLFVLVASRGMQILIHVVHLLGHERHYLAITEKILTVENEEN